jgi:hypothetical protein
MERKGEIMIFRMKMSDPNSVKEAMAYAVKECLGSNLKTEEQKVLYSQEYTEGIEEMFYKWFKRLEYITVEIDTEREDIRVVGTAFINE